MIFLLQFGIKSALVNFSKTTNSVSLWKIYLRWFIPNCTQNRVITYTNMETFMNPENLHLIC